MPHPKKKQRLTGDDANCSAETAVEADQMTASASADDVGVDVLADIFGFLGGAKEIVRQRGVSKRWSEAVKKTIVPLKNFDVIRVSTYNAMYVMTRAMPKLQQIKIGYLGRQHKFNDGEDPDEERADFTTNWTTHDIEIISNFGKLKDLAIYKGAWLNGRYPAFFNFPLLQKLNIIECGYLKWDLEMLSGLPMLKELHCLDNDRLTGNINSLRVLKDSLEKVLIRICKNVEGSLMDLADFPHLNLLNLDGTAVTGDIRDIGENDFSSLEHLTLPKSVYGGHEYEFRRISDGPDLIRAIHLLKKQRPALIMEVEYWKLSEDSPEWYAMDEDDELTPFYICFVKAGSRVGYRWETNNGAPCEVDWLDPEPDRESSDYAEYVKELQEINREVKIFKGFHQPPTEEEYNRLLDRFEEEGGWW